ncbi:MAG: hypothetical protein KAG92_04570, partial [Deltaproteobacteria bacterium]|nr:hypothetical protein [Deltaproteobacteria bacterium]
MADSEDKHKSSYWEDEFSAAKKRLEKFHKDGDKVVSEFLGKDAKESGSRFKLNLFHSNVITVSSLLYGNLPKIDVSRRFADPNDDVSRVAAETMERVLNIHVEEDSESYSSVFEGVLQDRLLAGLGVARVRYDFETDDAGELKSESAPI